MAGNICARFSFEVCPRAYAHLSMCVCLFPPPPMFFVFFNFDEFGVPEAPRGTRRHSWRPPGIVLAPKKASETFQGRIFIDFKHYFGTLGGALGALLDDRRPSGTCLFTLLVPLFEIFLEVVFSARFGPEHLRIKWLSGVRGCGFGKINKSVW